MSVEEPRTEQRPDALLRTASSESGEADHLNAPHRSFPTAPFAGAPLDEDPTFGCWTSAADIAAIVFGGGPDALGDVDLCAVIELQHPLRGIGDHSKARAARLPAGWKAGVHLVALFAPSKVAQQHSAV